MCLILDTDVVHLLYPRPSQQFAPVHRAVTEKRARLVYGGELRREYQRMQKFWRILYRLDQDGSARAVSDNAVDTETQNISQTGLCVSNDPHIIALARVANVRLLCTDDRKLLRDFRNAVLLSDPRGHVYTRANHADLIRTKCRHIQQPPGDDRGRRR
jgi:hypothetical protein